MSERPEKWPPAGEPDVRPLPRDFCPCCDYPYVTEGDKLAATSPPNDLRTVRLNSERGWLGTTRGRYLVACAEEQGRVAVGTATSDGQPEAVRTQAALAASYARLALGES